MITYTVKHKKPGWVFWRRVRGVADDFVTMSGTPQEPQQQARTLRRADGSVVAIPGDHIVVFGPGRFKRVVEKMEREAGQSIRLREGY